MTGRWGRWVWAFVSCRWLFLCFSTSASSSAAVRRTSRPIVRTQTTRADTVRQKRGHQHKAVPKRAERDCAVEPMQMQMQKQLPLPKHNYYETLENDWGVFFWRPPGFLSNWTSSPFVYAAMAYLNAEQAIMHQKAVMFGDQKVAKQIMQTTDPREQKAFGRQVSGIDYQVWERAIPDLLFAILQAKFCQNECFGCALLQTGHKQLCESSPNDLMWGTGVSPQQAVLCGREEAKQWRGRNLLGKTLMKVRDALAAATIVEQSRNHHRKKQDKSHH